MKRLQHALKIVTGRYLWVVGMKVKSILPYLSRQDVNCFRLQIIDKKTASHQYYFPYACAGNFQGLEISKFCCIFIMKSPKIGRNIDKF